MINADRKETRPFAFGYSDTVYLPLEKGENILVLCLSEKFGGWGFKMRDMNAIYKDERLCEAWTIDGLSAPESVAYDPVRDVLYVSCFSDGSIAKIGLDGTIIARNWVSGLAAPTGLTFHDGMLYAIDRSGVLVINPETAEVSARHIIPEASFVNDIAIGEDGAIYVTDTFKNCVFRILDGKTEVLVEGKAIESPNGILAEKDRLLVGVSVDGSIKAVDLKTAAVTTFLTLGGGSIMDGLTCDGKGEYLFSDYYGRVCRADKNGNASILLDSRGPHGYAADFAYIPCKGLLIVPSLYGNGLTAYSCGLNEE
ncbi:MAG: hypothetical protein WC360_05800 [Opitutales bacterium]